MLQLFDMGLVHVLPEPIVDASEARSKKGSSIGLWGLGLWLKWRCWWWVLFFVGRSFVMPCGETQFSKVFLLCECTIFSLLFFRIRR